MAINVKINCINENCGKGLKFSKEDHVKRCTVKCTQCGTQMLVAFDIDADPQTFTVADTEGNVKSSGTAMAPAQKKHQHTVTYAPGALPPPPPPPAGAGLSSDGKLGPGVPPPPPGYEEKIPCYATLTKRGLMGFNGERYDLEQGSFFIGRFDEGEQSDIALTGDDTMSRRSCRLDITATPGGNLQYKLTVLRSTNPVLVNGIELAEGKHKLLMTGDVIKLGSTRLKFKE